MYSVTRRTITCCFLTIFIALGSTVAQDKPITPTTVLDTKATLPDITTFMQIGAASFTAVSWDGKAVYFTSSLSGAPQVYRLIEGGWPYQLTTFEDGIDFFVPNWGADLSVVGASIGGSENSQLFLMNNETGRTYQLTNNPKARYISINWAKDDRSFYYSSNEEDLTNFKIYSMDVATGQSTKILGDTTGVHGSLYVVNLSQDGARFILTRANANVDQDLFLVDAKTRKCEQITKDTADVIYDSPVLMPDNKTIMMVCNDNPDGRLQLARLRLGSTAVEFINDGWLDPKWDLESIAISRDYKYIAALVNEDGYNRLKLREVESKVELPLPKLDGMIGGGAFDSEGRVYLSFNSPTRTSDVWRWVPATKELTQLTFSSYAGIDRTLFTEPQLIRFRSFDSLEISAFLYLPPNYKPGEPIPFIVDAHGGPESQFQPSFQRNLQYFMLNGYGILAPNPRGSSGYGRSFLALDNYKNRKNSLKDYRAAVEWLIQNGYTAPGKIAIRGGSYGGYVVLGMITDYPDMFSAAISSVGIANYETFLKNTAAYRRKLREAEYGPLADSLFLRSISPIHKADQIKTPLLLIHGANDPRVPIDEARQMAAAINANHGVVDSLFFVDEGHGASKRPNVITEYRRQVAFLDTHLKGLEPKKEM